MKRICYLSIFLLVLLININVYASDKIVVKEDNKSTYIPTNIVNGTFDEVPWMAFTFEGHTYSKEELDDFEYDNFSHGDQVEIIYNGINEGWNTTTNFIYADGKLFDWTKMTNWNLADHAIDATYNYYLQTEDTYSFIEMNGFEAAVFFQDLNTKGGDVIRWTLNHGIRPTYEAPDVQNISVEIGAPKVKDGKMVLAHGVRNDLHTEIEETSSAKYTKDGVVNGSQNSGFANIDELKNLSLDKYSQDDGWYDARGVYVIPKDQNVTRFAFISDVDNGDGNMLDDITFSTLIGNLTATLNEDKTVTVSGYWGETDPNKKLVIKIGDKDYSLDMSNISGNFTFDISEDLIGEETYIEVYHQDYEQAKRFVKIVEGTVSRNIDSPNDNIKILSNDEVIVNSLDNQSKLKVKHGENVEFFLEITDITKDSLEEVKSLTSKIIEEDNIGSIYDISIYKKLESDTKKIKIEETNELIEFSLKVPNELINTDENITRTYKIIRIHNDNAEYINATYDENNKALIFKTDKFSKYIITYSDKNLPLKPLPVDPIPNDPIPKNPKTGSDNTAYIVSFIISSICTLSTLCYIKYVNKEEKNM